jgi:hypothetical protein
MASLNRDQPDDDEVSEQVAKVLRRREKIRELQQDSSLVNDTESQQDEVYSKYLRFTNRRTSVADVEHGHGGSKKGANHKRSAASDPNVQHLEKLHRPLHECNTTAELSRHSRSDVEEPRERVRKRRRRSPSSQPQYAQPTVEHEASAMAGKSPGRKRKQYSSSKKRTALEDLPDGAASSPTHEDEISDSQASYVCCSINRRIGSLVRLDLSILSACPL